MNEGDRKEMLSKTQAAHIGKFNSSCIAFNDTLCTNAFHSFFIIVCLSSEEKRRMQYKKLCNSSFLFGFFFKEKKHAHNRKVYNRAN